MAQGIFDKGGKFFLPAVAGLSRLHHAL